MNPHTLDVENLGQIKQAKVEFGDLTVFVGPQATGKSIFLQLLKLLVDNGPILSELSRFNIGADARQVFSNSTLARGCRRFSTVAEPG